MKRMRIKVNGDVQGVFYRYYAKREAKRVGINGWVRNIEDGSVEALIEGEDEAVKNFIRWSSKGSPMATVEDVETSEENYTGELGKFEVR